MLDAEIAALAHADLLFNAPLSQARAAELVGGLDLPAGARVLDLGCGWGEFLLQVLAAHPASRGTGVDVNPAAIARAAGSAATRGLAERVVFEVAAASANHRPAEAVLCVGASHAFGGTAAALSRLRSLVRRHGRLLFGEAFWEHPPSAPELAGLGEDEVGPGSPTSLAELVDLALASGFRPLRISVANQDEWHEFESRWCAGLERWLLAHPDAPDADQVRRAVDEHRDGWLRGYRGALGFAYLTLAPTAAR